jgi:hypothetical protein
VTPAGVVAPVDRRPACFSAAGACSTAGLQAEAAPPPRRQLLPEVVAERRKVGEFRFYAWYVEPGPAHGCLVRYRPRRSDSAPEQGRRLHRAAGGISSDGPEVSKFRRAPDGRPSVQ